MFFVQQQTQKLYGGSAYTLKLEKVLFLLNFKSKLYFQVKSYAKFKKKYIKLN